jgi:hypothetical protein
LLGENSKNRMMRWIRRWKIIYPTLLG